MKMTGGTIYGNHPAVKEAIEIGINFDIPDDKIHLSKYGQMRSLWIKSEKMRDEENRLVLTGHPNRELEYFHYIVADAVWKLWEKMMKEDKANEPNTMTDYWGHVGWMEMHKARAEEIVLNEMVYVK